jgi:DNA-binding IclR family transcriptional regulator
MTKLLNYLLDNSDRIPNGMIVDCLKLARLDPKPFQRFPPARLAQQLGTTSLSEVSRRLGRLYRRGLLDYEKGVPYKPGYTIFRVGPKP